MLCYIRSLGKYLSTLKLSSAALLCSTCGLQLLVHVRLWWLSLASNSAAARLLVSCVTLHFAVVLLPYCSLDPDVIAVEANAVL
jgi:hypothetical protein